MVLSKHFSESTIMKSSITTNTSFQAPDFYPSEDFYPQLLRQLQFLDLFNLPPLQLDQCIPDRSDAGCESDSTIYSTVRSAHVPNPFGPQFPYL